MGALGGAASLLAAYLFQEVVRLSFPAEFDWIVVAFAFVAAAATGIAIGMLPALRASRTPERTPTGGGSSPARSRLASTLLVAQVAMSLALLVGAGLFVRTLVNLQNVDPGFDSSKLVLFTIRARLQPLRRGADRSAVSGAHGESLAPSLACHRRRFPAIPS